jgi:SAM-dependent methyltransferase
MIRSAVQVIRKIDGAVFGRFADQYERALEREIEGCCESLLDVGCGASSPIRRFATKLKYSVGVDAFEAAIAESRLARIHTEYRVMDVMQIENQFAPRSFDCVLACDLIEHLRKPDGLTLIRMMEKIAKKKVIIFTPNGFLPQAAYDGNEFQTHLSGWDIAEMRALGYRVVGINGWKPLRGKRARFVWWPAPLWRRVSFLTQGITERHPEWAFQMLCIKEIEH